MADEENLNRPRLTDWFGPKALQKHVFWMTQRVQEMKPSQDLRDSVPLELVAEVALPIIASLPQNRGEGVHDHEAIQTGLAIPPLGDRVNAQQPNRVRQQIAKSTE
ncbi:hypothetical protein [Acidimangrovimonas pyrenivorans]|uniref:Uncharacterized protein n=1 Tax=Acidimangrovimonas pyrenivorans TaxID=2030798 RepID=A0ABV7AJB1_9RHOB